MKIHAIQTATVAVTPRQPDGGGRDRRSFAGLFADHHWTASPAPLVVAR